MLDADANGRARFADMFTSYRIGIRPYGSGRENRCLTNPSGLNELPLRVKRRYHSQRLHLDPHCA